MKNDAQRGDMDERIERRFVNVARSKTFHHLRTYAGLEHKAVLDVGCSHGEFLAHFGQGSVGLTIQPTETVFGAKKGLRIRVGNIEDPALEIAEKFDAIFANNIFEHLYSPHAFLIKAKIYLKQNGVLVLGVPCIPYLSWLMRFKKFRGSLADNHINFFTKQSLRYTVERAGWKVECVRGFRISDSFLDRLLDSIYPHFYVVARPDPSFVYSDERLKELAGYVSGPYRI